MTISISKFSFKIGNHKNAIICFSLSIPLRFVHTSLERSLSAVVEPQNKLVWLTTAVAAASSEQAYLREGMMSVKLLNEELRAEFITVPMKKFSPFFEECRIIIQRLFEMGHKITTVNANVDSYKSRHDDIDAKVPPLVLNMGDLKIGFLVCSIPLMLSLVAFMCEITSKAITAMIFVTLTLFIFLRFISAIPKLKIGLH